MIKALIALIVLDAALTYIGVAYLGAHEMLLLFVNQAPELVWPYAMAKVLAALYLFRKAGKYPRIKYGLYLITFMHAAAVANNAYLILRHLSQSF